MKPTVFKLSFISSAMLLSYGGIAQEKNTQQNTAQLKEDKSLERITISARKKFESVQDVGLSVTSLNPEDLRNLGVNRTEDLTKVVPALDIKQANAEGNVNVTLRGVGLNDYSSTMGPTVGVYMDEVFLPASGMLNFSLFDVERVEVLKGPQGTLYGRNTTGGAITFMTAKPVNDDLSGYVQGSYGNYGTSEVQGAVTTGLTDELSVRLAGIVRNQSESFYTNFGGNIDPDTFSFTPDGSSKNLGSSNMYAFRLSALYEGQDLDIYANVHFGKQKFPPAPLEHFAGIDADTFDICSTYAAGQINTQNDPTCIDFVGFKDDPSTGAFGGYYEDYPKNEISTEGGTLKFEYQTALGMVTAISAYESFERDATDDISMNPYPEYLTISTAHNKIDAISQEIRLTGGNDSVNYIVGGFYGKDNVDAYYYVDGQLLFPSLFGIPGDIPVQIDLDNIIDQETKTMALFTNIEWSLTANLDLIAGLRYTKEQKVFNGLTEALGLDSFTEAFFIDVFGISPLPLAEQVNNKLDSSKLTGSLGLEWKVQDNILLYSTVSQGFKTGGYKGHIAFDQYEYDPYRGEDLTSYEFGIKTRNEERTLQLNASAFYYDYKDFQALVPAGIALALGNVDSATLKGLEVDSWWNITENFSVKAAATWLDTDIQDPTGLYEGHKMANAPEFSANLLLSYEIDVTDDYYLRLQTDVKYSGETYMTTVNSPIEKVDSYNLLNARATFAPLSDDWQLSLWVKNLNDERYFTQIYDQAGDFGAAQAFYGEPRTYGMTFTFNY